ncbi:MAG: hypothetical protein BV457_01625 [Thermoplasmata archaeon M9B1D]|nr:MAG: hypothetical protein BV457_01625 [Thermoplasmata archaeon M9B1D]
MEKGKKPIKSEMLNQAITNKAYINIGSKFWKLKFIEFLKNDLPWDYRETDTIFKKYREKFLQLQEEYFAELRKAGINPDLFKNQRPGNYDNELLGQAISNVYPYILDNEKAKAWNDLNSLIAEIMAGEY